MLPNRPQRFIEKANHFIQQNIYNENLSIVELSAHLNLSESQTYKKIKEKSGFTPAIYIRNIKLEKANTLIQQTDYTISQIADQLGFCSLSYFSRSFSKYYGFPPSELKRKCQSK